MRCIYWWNNCYGILYFNLFFVHDIGQIFQLLKYFYRSIFPNFSLILILCRSMLRNKNICWSSWQKSSLRNTFKSSIPLSEEFQCDLFVESYYEYSWQPFQVLDKRNGGTIPQLQIQILQYLLLPHNDSVVWVIFFKNIWKLTFYLIPCNVEEHVEKLLQFSDLYTMTCVHCRLEDKLSVFIKTTPSCIQKERLKLCFCVWKRMTWSWISESTFPPKMLSHNSWKTAQLSKMLCNDVPLTVQRFEHNTLSSEIPGSVLSSEIPGAVSSPNLIETASLFREYLIIIFLSMIFKP